jgi:hypothetical protein
MAQGHILQTTALVNEAFLRLIDWRNVEWQAVPILGWLADEVAHPGGCPCPAS